jgi:Domain of unknown function (DUF4142)
MRLLRACAYAATLLAAAGSQVGLASAAPAAQGAAATAPARGNAVESLQAQAARLLRLSKLQHAAEREVQLALVAETGASRAETRRYAADLGADFRRLTARIAKVAESMQIDDERLRRLFAGENTAALRREAVDLDSLAKQRGEAFDRQFWIIVTHEQMAASDMLGGMAGDDPRIDPLVADMALLLERATGNAVVAAKAVTSTTGRIVPASAPSPVMPPPPAAIENASPPAPADEATETDEAAPAEGPPPAADTPAKR